MKRVLLVALAISAALLVITACAGAPTPTAVPAPTVASQPTAPSLPTAPPPTLAAPQPTVASSQPSAAAPQPPTAAPQPTAAAPAPTDTVQAAAPTTEATSAASSATPAPAASSPSAPPGLYVTSVRLDPEQPTHAQNISFYVSFLNTAQGVQNVKWQVYIYRADNPTRRNNETTVLQTTFNTGPIELQAEGSFRFGSTGNACDFFFARVDQLDINSKGVDLTKPDGQVFEKGFTICG